MVNIQKKGVKHPKDDKILNKRKKKSEILKTGGMPKHGVKYPKEE